MSQLDLIEKKMLLALYTPVNSAIMIETSLPVGKYSKSSRKNTVRKFMASSVLPPELPGVLSGLWVPKCLGTAVRDAQCSMPRS